MWPFSSQQALTEKQKTKQQKKQAKRIARAKNAASKLKPTPVRTSNFQGARFHPEQ